MQCVVLILTVSVLCCAVCIQALECSMDSRSTQRELQQTIETCTHKKSDDQGKTDDYEEEDSTETTTQGYRNRASRYKRSENMTQETTTVGNEDMDSNTTVTNQENCVVQCILTQLGMVDNSGYPEYELVLQTLLKRANNRELRDFIQETTNECFQLMGQGEKQEACDYSTTLVKCLAEKGKENCADWPIGNVSLLD